MLVRMSEVAARTVISWCCENMRNLESSRLTVFMTERDHILGISYSPRLYVSHISIWTKKGHNRRSIEALQKTILTRVSEDLRPASESEYYYKKHSDHEGFCMAVEDAKR